MTDHFCGPEFILRSDGQPDYIRVQSYYRQCEKERCLHLAIQVERRRKKPVLVQCSVSCCWEHLRGRKVALTYLPEFQQEVKKHMMCRLDALREASGLPRVMRPQVSFDWLSQRLTFTNVPESLTDALARETRDTVNKVLNDLDLP